MSRLIICSVGTSLLEKDNEDIKEIKETLSVKTDYLSDDEFYQEYINRKETNEFNIVDLKASSETYSLSKLNLSEGDFVYLLSTRTFASKYCGDLIIDYLKKEYSKVSFKHETINELKSATDENFGEVGLPAFLNKLVNIITDSKYRDKEKILNPTGGYKSLFPVMTIVGMLYECKVIYLYEESENIIEIPPLPIGIDIIKWNRIRNFVKFFKNQNFSSPSIPDNLKPIFNDLKGFLSHNQRSKFYDFFESNIKSLESRFNTLFFKTKNYSLRNYLGDYKDKFDSLVDLNYLIWKGDRVPEMVDHSIRHHTNLFNFAEQILLPILIKNEKILESHHIFILLCCLFLHDSGHVIGYVKKGDEIYKLYPTEIRDFHHILTYLRFKNYDNDDIYFSKTFYEELKWGEDTNTENIWNNYLNAITKICMYHRKKMPLLTKEQKKFTCWFYDDEIKPLEEEEIYFNGKKIEPEKALLICALLRIIDSLDCQIARSGDETEIKFHTKVIENEKKSLDIKSDKIKKIINEKYLKDIDGFIEKVSEGHKSDVPGAIKDNKKPDFREELNKLLKEIETKDLLLVEEYIDAKLNADFKGNQIEHFGTHSKIKNVVIDFDNTDEKFIFKISLQLFVENTTDQEKEHYRNLLKDMESEYNIVKEILERHNIFFEYSL